MNDEHDTLNLYTVVRRADLYDNKRSENGVTSNVFEFAGFARFTGDDHGLKMKRLPLNR